MLKTRVATQILAALNVYCKNVNKVRYLTRLDILRSLSPKLLTSCSEKKGLKLSSGEFIGDKDEDDEDVMEGDGEPQPEGEP